MMIEKRLQELNLTLPDLSEPGGNFISAKRAGDMLFLAGKGPGPKVTGKVGRDLTVEQAYQHARTIGLGLVAVMKQHVGDLDRVKGIIKVLGMVNSVPDFRDHPKVINGCSDLFVEIFGEKGRHARSAVGMSSLPGQIPVEIEAVVLID